MSEDWYSEGVKSLNLTEQPLEYLAAESARDHNPFAAAAMAEITRRTAQAQIDTAIAQRDAARWMKWSAVILGIAAILAAVFQWLAWLWPNPLTH